MTSPTLAWTPNRYPLTRRSDHVDVYRSEAGVEVKVSDPYDWLEKDSEEQEKWLAAQEALARNFLDANPDRVRLEEEIRASTDYEKFGPPILRDDGRWYWSYNSGLQAQSVYYRSKDSDLPDSAVGAGGEVFFDVRDDFFSNLPGPPIYTKTSAKCSFK